MVTEIHSRENPVVGALRRYVAEFVGTFALLFVGTGAIMVNEISGGGVTNLGVALSFGSVVTVVVYALGPISGAHINPAVTLAFAVLGRMRQRDIVPYLLAQLGGGLAASALLWAILGNVARLGATLPRDGNVLQSLVLEVAMTFLLVLVIVSITNQASPRKEFDGLAIGMTITLNSLFGGPISGASMNPARSLAPAILAGVLTQHQWLYILGPAGGALIAVGLYQFLCPIVRRSASSSS